MVSVAAIHTQGEELTEWQIWENIRLSVFFLFFSTRVSGSCGVWGGKSQSPLNIVNMNNHGAYPGKDFIT